MDKPMSNLNFRIHVFIFKIRDFLTPRGKILEEADLKPGSRVLDFGCGPGSYSLAAAELVGNDGKVYALDLHPLAIESVKKSAAKKRFLNIETIQSSCDTGLEDRSLDTVFLFDTFHDFENPDELLKELHRVMKADAVLLFSDHHLKTEEIQSKLTRTGLFEFQKQGKHLFMFTKKA